ncbi:AsmA-like C-terminal region-containing protein [Candidatus Pelagibacter sp.]|nr:AsmA-like C-terminal region-containing protein [Candidatus Pelagibacter sp.]
MKILIIRTGILLISIFLILIIFLSTIGIKTNKLNNQIQNQLEKVNKDFRIELKDVSIILDPLKFKLNLKTIGTNLKYKNREIQLEKIESNISLKSILSNEFSLKKLIISTKPIKVKNLISLFRILNNDPKLLIAEQFIKSGYLIADINIEFNNEGKIKDNFYINGYVKNGNVNLLRKAKLSKMNFNFNLNKNEFAINDFSFLLNNKKFLIPQLRSQYLNDKFVVSGKAYNKRLILSENDLKKFIDTQHLNLKLENIELSSESQFSFDVDKNFKFNDVIVKSNISLDNLELSNKFPLKQFFPQFENKINFKNHKINLEYKKDFLLVEGEGDFLIKENDKIEYKILKQKEIVDFSSVLKISNNKIKFAILNYQNEDNSNMKINIIGKKNLKKNFLFKEISLTEKNNNIVIKNLLLNNSNKIQKIDKIDLDYTDKENIKNKILIVEKNKNYILQGETFNGNQLIENLLKSSNKNENIFSENFKIDINIKKVNLDKDNILKNLKGFLILKDNKVSEANLDSRFLSKKKIKLTIKTVNGEKITTLFSGEAKPFIDRYKFIKGFDDGSLDFNSISKGNNTNSVIKIYDFKLKELPALTKVLTLASLQGIADVLSGEGIRFNEFEMNFSNKNQLMSINEIYAIGPAISILMEGYVESDKLVSLRGTLIPATTLNKVIGSIPFLGNILVGKKTGEGVFGVSFKIKGPPEKLETSVNPIKTLTPRFITRTLENIKNN